MPEFKPGRTAYDTYCRTIPPDLHPPSGLPHWDALPMPEKSAWQNAALAVLDNAEAAILPNTSRDANERLLGLFGWRVLHTDAPFIQQLIDMGILQVREQAHNPVDRTLCLTNADESSEATLKRLLTRMGVPDEL